MMDTSIADWSEISVTEESDSWSRLLAVSRRVKINQTQINGTSKDSNMIPSPETNATSLKWNVLAGISHPNQPRLKQISAYLISTATGPQIQWYLLSWLFWTLLANDMTKSCCSALASSKAGEPRASSSRCQSRPRYSERRWKYGLKICNNSAVKQLRHLFSLILNFNNTQVYFNYLCISNWFIKIS